MAVPHPGSACPRITAGHDPDRDPVGGRSPVDLIIERLDCDDALQYIAHLRDEHLSGGPFTLADCRHCYMKILTWIATGVVDISEMYAATDTPTTPPAPEPPQQQPSTAGNVLDVIDADGHMLCGCGCRVRITDQSPSAYFATQECSERWHGHRAGPTPPRAGPAPRPADTIPTGREPATWWLGQVSPQIAESAIISYTRSSAGLLVSIGIPSAVDTHRDQGLDHLLHTRTCDRCRHRTAPETVHDATPASVEVTIDDVAQRCGNCGTDLPGRPLFGRIERLEGDLVRLHLENGAAATHTVLTVNTKARTGTPTAGTIARARCAWDRLELDLHRFNTGWQPPTGAPAPGDDRPYFIDVPPPPRVRPILPWRGGRQ